MRPPILFLCPIWVHKDGEGTSWPRIPTKGWKQKSWFQGRQEIDFSRPSPITIPEGSAWLPRGWVPVGLRMYPVCLTHLSVWFPETCDCEGYPKGHYVGELLPWQPSKPRPRFPQALEKGCRAWGTLISLPGISQQKAVHTQGQARPAAELERDAEPYADTNLISIVVIGVCSVWTSPPHRAKGFRFPQRFPLKGQRRQGNVSQCLFRCDFKLTQLGREPLGVPHQTREFLTLRAFLISFAAACHVRVNVHILSLYPHAPRSVFLTDRTSCDRTSG